MGHPMDFKADTRLCPPDMVYFTKNHLELGLIVTTFTNMHAQRYSIDWNIMGRFIVRCGFDIDSFFGLNCTRLRMSKYQNSRHKKEQNDNYFYVLKNIR
jgi:hypothetical protein